MKRFAMIGAAFALASSATANAAADCCKEMTCRKEGAYCCKDGKGDCCKDLKQGGDHAGHDILSAPAK